MGTTVPLEIVSIVGVVLFILVLWKVTSVGRVRRNKPSKIEEHTHRPAEVYQTKYQSLGNKEKIDENLSQTGKIFLKLIKLLIARSNKN